MQLTVGSQVAETVYIAKEIHHIVQEFLEYKIGFSYIETAIMCMCLCEQDLEIMWLFV